MRKYWFTALLCFTVVIIVTINTFAGWLLPGNKSDSADGTAVSDLSQTETVAAVRSVNDGQLKPGGGSEAQGEPGSNGSGVKGASGNDGSGGAASSGDDPSTEAETSSDADQSQSADSQEDRNFAGALFIGDSRTVGLSEYGNLGDARIFANTGMSVYNLWSTEVQFAGEGKKKLEDVLSEGSYNTIYLMLGINELGYNYGQTVKKYQEVVDEIKAKEPDAVLALEANLHVTKDKAAKSSVFTNDKINTFNQAVAAIAQEKGCVYLDINALFDDADGNMGAQYSTDGVHVLGKYYSAWSNWLRQNQPPLPAK